MAPPSQPGTSTHTTVMSAVPPAADTTASRVAIGSRASATTTSSARPESRSSAASASWGTIPTVRCAPASAAAARLSEPDLPAPPMTATTGCSYCADEAMGQGRRTAHVHHGEAELGREVVGDHGRDRAAEEHGVPVARDLLRAARPSARSPSSMTSGVSVSETRVATRSPTARPSGDSGPTSSTVPTSIPPEPVSGFCILPRAATISRTCGTDRPSPHSPVRALELAERRRVEVEALDPHPDLVGPQLAAGCRGGPRPAAAPAAGPGPGATRSDRWRARSFSSVTYRDRRIYGAALDRPEILHLQCHSDH